MSRLRDVVATELANQQIHHIHFLADPQTSSIHGKSAGNSSKHSHIENSDSDFEDILKPDTKRRAPLPAIAPDPTNIVELTWKDLCAMFCLIWEGLHT